MIKFIPIISLKFFVLLFSTATNAMPLSLNDLATQLEAEFGKPIAMAAEYSETEITIAEPINKIDFADFLEILQQHRFTVLKEDNYTLITPIKYARTMNIPLLENHRSNTNLFMTDVIQLKHLCSLEVFETIRPLVQKAGHIAVYNAANTLVITDNFESLTEIKNIVATMESEAEDIACADGSPAPGSDKILERWSKKIKTMTRS